MDIHIYALGGGLFFVGTAAYSSDCGPVFEYSMYIIYLACLRMCK